MSDKFQTSSFGENYPSKIQQIEGRIAESYIAFISNALTSHGLKKLFEKNIKSKFAPMCSAGREVFLLVDAL